LKSNNLSNIRETNVTIGQLESQVKKLEELSNIELIEGDIAEVKNNIHVLQNVYDAIVGETNDEVGALTDTQVNLRQKGASIITLGKNKKKEIDFIEKGICPTCGAPIDQSQLENKKKERDLLLEQYYGIEAQIKDIDKAIYNIKKEAQERLDITKEAINSDKKLLTRLEEQTKRLNVNKTEIDALNSKIDSQKEILNIYQAEDGEWQQLYDILTSQVRAKILNSFIPALNKNILHYSQRLHLPYIVQFDANFKCNISLCGMDQPIPVSSLSTGQLKTVDVVIILGVLGTVIGSNGINILFLDELFSNLDANLRNEMCQLLRETLKPDSTIFIISHTDLENKYFDGDIYMKLELKDQYEKHSICRIQKFEGDH
jgi:DNA repair exonuclease SbcCD ATPase subunit